MDTSKSKVISQSDEHDKVKVSRFENEQVDVKHISNEAIEIAADTENYEELPHKKVICAEQLIFGEKLSDLDINLFTESTLSFHSTLLQDKKLTVSDKSVQYYTYTVLILKIKIPPITTIMLHNYST